MHPDINLFGKFLSNQIIGGPFHSKGSLTRKKVVAHNSGTVDAAEMMFVLDFLMNGMTQMICRIASEARNNANRLVLSLRALGDAICPRWRAPSVAPSWPPVTGTTTSASSARLSGTGDALAMPTILAHGKSVR